MLSERDAVVLLRDTFGPAVISDHEFRGDVTVFVHRTRIIDVLTFLRDDKRLLFDMLIDLTAVDYLHYEPETKAERFEVVYHLRSMATGARIRVKAPVPEDDCQVPSAVALYKIADWLEREVWDMMGIVFTGHPHLSRILMYEEFVGHPLRKDYPYNKEQPQYTIRERSTDRQPVWVR